MYNPIWLINVLNKLCIVGAQPYQPWQTVPYDPAKGPPQQSAVPPYVQQPGAQQQPGFQQPYIQQAPVQQVVTVTSGPQVVVVNADAQYVPDYLVANIFACLCCCCCIGKTM